MTNTEPNIAPPILLAKGWSVACKSLIASRRPAPRNGNPKAIRTAVPSLDWEVTIYFLAVLEVSGLMSFDAHPKSNRYSAVRMEPSRGSTKAPAGVDVPGFTSGRLWVTPEGAGWSATLPLPAHPAHEFGPIPIRSLTADRIRCVGAWRTRS